MIFDWSIEDLDEPANEKEVAEYFASECGKLFNLTIDEFHARAYDIHDDLYSGPGCQEYSLEYKGLEIRLYYKLNRDDVNHWMWVYTQTYEVGLRPYCFATGVGETLFDAIQGYKEGLSMVVRDLYALPDGHLSKLKGV